MSSRSRQNLDAQLARILEMMPVVDLSDVQKTRHLNASTKMPVPAGAQNLDIHERLLPGTPPIRVRLYIPKTAKPPLATVLYCHPGLFFGTLEMDHARCVDLAAGAECIVVSVDYRLAPENPFPAAIDDAYTTLLWISREGTTLGMDASRIAVAGCSTGATLAAGIALVARDRKGPRIALQMLIYPALDDRLNTESMEEFSQPGVMEAGRVGSEHVWALYAGKDRRQLSPYAAPARASDLRDLPHTYLVTAEFDCLRDEGIAYATRLINAGVPTELHHFPGCFHAFDMVARTAAVSRRAAQEQIAAIKRVMAPSKSLTQEKWIASL